MALKRSGSTLKRDRNRVSILRSEGNENIRFLHNTISDAS